MRKAFRSLTSSFILLLISFSAAVFIWVHAVQTEDPIRAEFLPIPVQFVNQPEHTRLVRPSHSQTIQVWFQGVSSVVTGTSSDDFLAVVDLEDVPLGEETAVPIQVRSTINGISILSKSTEAVDVFIEEQISREIPVLLDIRGQIALGHEMGEPLIEPDSVLVTGPAGQVEAIEAATATIFLLNVRETAVYTVEPIFHDEYNDPVSISGLDISTDLVDVTIPVVAADGYAEKVIVVDLVGDIAEGHRLLGVAADPATVLLKGFARDLSKITSITTEPVDITGLTEPTTYPVSLILPDGITLAESTPEIFVEVNVEPFMSTETYRPQIELQGVGEGLTAVADPEAIHIVLFGPLPVLNTLLAEEIHATIDLFDLEAGTYNLEPIIDYPDRGLELRSIDFPIVTIEITNTVEMTETIPITETAATVPYTERDLHGQAYFALFAAVHDLLVAISPLHLLNL